MATPSRIFNQQVFKIDSTSSGEKTFEFQVENDGFVLTIEYVSGTEPVSVEVFDILPDDMSFIKLDVFGLTSSTREPIRKSYIAGRRASVRLTWTDTAKIVFTVRAVSAQTITLLNNHATGKETNRLLTLVLASLSQNQQTGLGILNHLREITNIKPEEGEIF